MAGARARLVLIVEDDKTTGDLLASAFNEQRGYEALAVASGDAALDALGRIDPDLLLLDIRMPGMSGLDLYDRVRADPRFRSLPIVFETGTGREHAAELRARGIATYIKKPFDIEELVRFVRRLVPPRTDNPKTRAVGR
ncbi:MAG TPA: response regulator [Candidatus Limnocylindria bacterium]